MTNLTEGYSLKVLCTTTKHCEGTFIVIKIIPIMTYIVPLSSMKLTGWQKETGLGLEKTILQDKAHGSICPSSPLHGLITPVIDIKIKSKPDIKTNQKRVFVAQNYLFFIK